jgi:hypothetical protein
MTSARNIPSVLFFSVFFSIGTAALTCSILCDDLLDYYRKKDLLAMSEASIEELRSLIADYDSLLEHLCADPNIMRRIGPATIGAEQADPDTARPRATAEQLEAARQALMQDAGERDAKPAAPVFLLRCSRPAFRIMLAAAGSALVLISFVWFGKGG